MRSRDTSKTTGDNGLFPYRTKASGTLFVLLSVTSMSISSVLIKLGLTAGIGPVDQLALRMAVGALVLWTVFLIFKPQYIRIDRSGFCRCGLAAVTNGLSSLFYYLALTRIEASLAMVIFSVYPIMALGFLSFGGERITPLGWSRFALAITGVYLAVNPAGHGDVVGVLLVLGTAVFFALHLNLIQWHLNGYAPQTTALYVISLMALMLGGASLFQPHRIPFSWTGCGVILTTGIVSTALARVAMFAGVRHIGSGEAALLGPMETLLAVAWAYVFLGERLSPLQLAGALLILGSASMSFWKRSPLTH